MKKKIQDFNIGYWLLKGYVRFAIRQFYSGIKISGMENIPRNKSVIFAPNHQNALMDPLLLLYSRPGRTVFMARADIFKKKTVANILYFLKILPIYRIRDGVDELDKNYAIFEQAAGVLRDDVPLCLMPEGKQSFQRKLLPLVKGMFRIAFKAQEEMPGKEIVIIPTGIDYEDYVHSGTQVVIRFGKPIEIREYMPLYRENLPKAMNILRDDVSQAISTLIQDIRSDTHYEDFYQLSLIGDESVCRLNQKEETPLHLLQARQEIARELDTLESSDPEKADKLCEACRQYMSVLKKLRVRDKEIQSPPSLILLIVQLTGLITGLPFFITGWIANGIPAYTPRLITRKLKTDDFRSSFTFVLWLVFYLVYYLILFITAGFVTGWIESLGIIVCSALCGKFAYLYLGWMKDFGHKLRYLFAGTEKYSIHPPRIADFLR